MTDTIREPFCPLYREAIQAEPWKNIASAHAGLLFDKFAHAWRSKQDKGRKRAEPFELEFDKGVGPKKKGANEWINRFKRPVGNPARLKEACDRQRQMIDRLGGRVLLLTNTDRFVTGMGREHPLENGFAWHHTLGVPYLSGSSLKGMLRAWLRERDGGAYLKETEEAKRWFGTQGKVGQLILFDMLPLDAPLLTVDVMTPHYGPYYQKGEVPGDWHSPVPITFLVVEAGASWQVGIAPAAGSRAPSDAEFDHLVSALLEAIEIAGAGAKTAVGYGRFSQDKAAEERIHKQQEQRRAEQKERERRSAEQVAFEASLAGDSEPLRQLKKLQRKQDWKPSAGDQNLVHALQEFADAHPSPPADCLQWIRELLESIPNYEGVWDNPNAMKGKKKNKFKYSSPVVRRLVERLNPEFHNEP